MKRQTHVRFVGEVKHLEPRLALPEPAPAHVDQEDCDVCGARGQGSYGYSCFIGVRGHWACKKSDCRAEARSRASGQRNLIAAE